MMITHYSNKQREKLLKELTKDKKFMKFAKEEFEERKSIEGVFGFREVFEDDLKDNLENYNELWEDEKMFEFLKSTDEETAQKLTHKALKDLDF